ncbi:hypothetical protein ACFL67_03920 [candidate division KSB1 bacterium]
MLSKIKYVFETYPPSTYPKLYPKPIEYYENARHNYRNLNLLILLAGLLLLAVLLVYPRSGEWDRAIVTWYFMAQFFPILLVEIKSFKYYKLMRLTDSRTTRRAELKPRRLFDFISPRIFGLAVLVYFAFIVFIHYFRQLGIPWFAGYWNIVGITAINLFFAGIIIWNMYGKRLDPYQVYEDRRRQIELIVHQMVFTSIAATIFVTIEIALSGLDMRNLQPAVTSLYFQLIAAIGLRTLRIDKINFEVYKEDSSAVNKKRAI